MIITISWRKIRRRSLLSIFSLYTSLEVNPFTTPQLFLFIYIYIRYIYSVHGILFWPQRLYNYGGLTLDPSLAVPSTSVCENTRAMNVPFKIIRQAPYLSVRKRVAFARGHLLYLAGVNSTMTCAYCLHVRTGLLRIPSSPG